MWTWLVVFFVRWGPPVGTTLSAAGRWHRWSRDRPWRGWAAAAASLGRWRHVSSSQFRWPSRHGPRYAFSTSLPSASSNHTHTLYLQRLWGRISVWLDGWSQGNLYGAPTSLRLVTIEATQHLEWREGSKTDRPLFCRFTLMWSFGSYSRCGCSMFIF